MYGYSLEGVAWNVFLALVPVFLARAVSSLADRRGPAAAWAAIGLGAAWLAFLPNTCYLLTEWRHMLGLWAGAWAEPRPSGEGAVALMTDTFFYSAYSGVGALTFALAVRPVARLFRQRGWPVWPWAPLLFFSMAVGVYLGLVLRYNSWDLVFRPAQVWFAAAHLRFRPHLSLVLGLFAVFLWFLYMAVDIWVEGLSCRFRERRDRQPPGDMP